MTSIRRLSSVIALCSLLTAMACSGEAVAPGASDDDDDERSTESSDEPVKARDGGARRGSDAGKKSEQSSKTKDAGARPPARPGDEGDTPPDGDPGPDDVPAETDDPPSGGGSGAGIPCEVQKILEEKCALCHGEEAGSGAFPLVELAQFQGPSPGDEDRKMYEVAHERVNAKDNQRMPPASVEALDETQLATLSDWLEGGAKAGEACAETTPPDEPDMAAGMPKGMGGAQIEPIDYEDPELECHKFVAHARGDKTKPYSVPTRPDYYVAFNLKPTWQGKRYVRSFRNIIDNKAVIHHWLLFKLMRSEAESVTENALGIHPDAEMLYGWAPGGDDMYLHPDVGMEVDGNVTYQLEAHYNNATGSPKPDASGVEICMTKTKPTNVAALSWLGTDAINGTTASGTCTPDKNQTIRLFAALPHMHTKGKHMKVVVNRKSGMKETIHDEAFDFEYQRIYTKDVTLQPGDTVTTTCTYREPARFGKGTNDEMCYFFSMHWPANGLTSRGGLGATLHGPNSCM